MTKWTDVGVAVEIQAGIPITVAIDGAKIVVIKLDSEFYAIEDVCTHDGGQLSGGCIEGDRIICPRHGAIFSIKTGEVLKAPAYEPISVFPVQIENGIVQVRDNRFDDI